MTKFDKALQFVGLYGYDEDSEIINLIVRRILYNNKNKSFDEIKSIIKNKLEKNEFNETSEFNKMIHLFNVEIENIQNDINKNLKKLSTLNIKKIYGGQTEQELQNRQYQHEQINEEFENMTIKYMSETNCQYIAKMTETYLINKLDEIYGKNKVLNAYTKDGFIKQTGGNGVRHNKGDIHQLYVMYK